MRKAPKLKINYNGTLTIIKVNDELIGGIQKVSVETGKFYNETIKLYFHKCVITNPNFANYNKNIKLLSQIPNVQVYAGKQRVL